jgi:uncharacterized protein YggU (UPF0235/DUF167 family)
MENLELTPDPRGTRLRLRVRAGARQSRIAGVHAGALKLSVATAPEKGKANRAVLDLLATALALPASSLEIIAGPTSPNKTILVPLDPTDVRARLLQGS